jgi:hypothetical protein
MGELWEFHALYEGLILILLGWGQFAPIAVILVKLKTFEKSRCQRVEFHSAALRIFFIGSHPQDHGMEEDQNPHSKIDELRQILDK